MTRQRYRLDYLHLGQAPASVDDGVLYCDPLTSLVAYPSLEQCLTKMLPRLARDGLHLAIGDVDGLRDYVSERRADDPSNFGHLAGNACMRTVGALTNSWASAELSGVDFKICGTFGGDELIVAASAMSHGLFADKIHTLCQTIKLLAPRPCSFALATLDECKVLPDQAADAYRSLVSTIDARLFQVKEQARHNGTPLDGSVSDLGVVSLSGREAVRPARTGGGS